MRLGDILKATEKTAAVAPAAPATASNKDADKTAAALKRALTESLETPVKQASVAAPAGTPVAQLEKVASEVVAAEEEALLKQAHMFGAALMDGFMARGAMYDEAASKIAASEKTASADSFEKFAAENPALVREAMELGYKKAAAEIEEAEKAAALKGYQDGVEAIYKTASDSFMRGFEDCGSVLEALRR